MDVFKDSLRSKFDLIVCSEVLYYVGDKEKLLGITNKFSDALHPGGYFLTAHAYQIIDDPHSAGFDWGLSFGAKIIGDIIAKSGQLRLLREIRTPLYRIQLFKKDKLNIFPLMWAKKPSIQILDQPTLVPESVVGLSATLIRKLIDSQLNLMHSKNNFNT